MNRARQLPPIQRAQEETASALRDLRSQLEVLENQQSEAERRTAAQEAHSKNAKKSKSVLARRLLEHTRLQALQRRQEEATQRAAKIRDFNHAMEGEAEAHLDRVSFKLRHVPHSSNPLSEHHAARADLQLPVPNVNPNKRHGNRPVSGSAAAVSDLLRTELQVLGALSEELRPGPEVPSPAHETEAKQLPDVAAIQSVRKPDPATVQRLIDTLVQDQFLEQRAAARHAKVEANAKAKYRRAMMLTSGGLGTGDAIVDGFAPHESAEANLRRAREREALHAAASTTSIAHARHSSSTADESRKLAAFVHRDRVLRALEVQRGQLSRFQERLQQLEEEEDVADKERHIGDGEVFAFVVDDIENSSHHDSSSDHVEDAVCHRQQHTSNSEGRAVEQSASHGSEDCASQTAADCDTRSSQHDGQDRSDPSQVQSATEVKQLTPRSVDETVDAAVVAAREASAGSKARGRLIAALYQEVLETQATSACLVQSFLRQRGASSDALFRQCGPSCILVQSFLRQRIARRRCGLREHLAAKHPAGTVESTAARAIQMAHRQRSASQERQRRTAARNADLTSVCVLESTKMIQRAWRCSCARAADRTRQLRSHAAVKLQCLARQSAARQRWKRLMQQRRDLISALQASSDAEFAADPDMHV
jgi:hypothetical protein